MEGERVCTGRDELHMHGNRGWFLSVFHPRRPLVAYLRRNCPCCCSVMFQIPADAATRSGGCLRFKSWQGGICECMCGLWAQYVDAVASLLYARPAVHYRVKVQKNHVDTKKCARHHNTCHCPPPAPNPPAPPNPTTASNPTAMSCAASPGSRRASDANCCATSATTPTTRR